MVNKLNSDLNEYYIDSEGSASKTSVKIRYLTYFKGQGRPKHCLILCNGRSEWAEKYIRLPEDLNLPEDWMFVTLDHRGQGLSGGEKSWVAHYDDYASDLKAVINAATKGNVPYTICAHSMGGLISLYATLKGFIQPNKIVLLSPLFRLSNLPLNYALTKSTASLIALLGFSKTPTGAGNNSTHSFKGNKLTTCEKKYEICHNPPYKIPTATFGWVDATFKATQTINDINTLTNLNCDVMVIAGSDERVVDAKAFNQWVQLAGSLKKVEVEFHMISGARHELLMEKDKIRNVVINKIKKFITPAEAFAQ